jgi:single-strand DNA-binding protein
MKAINRFTIVGNIGSVTPFERSTKINIATNRHWTDDKGVKKEATDWVQITILDEKQAAWAAENAKPGDAVHAEGRISNNSYERDGAKVYATDLIAQVFNLFPKLDGAKE